jgi:SpoIID/LytB domain protein
MTRPATTHITAAIWTLTLAIAACPRTAAQDGLHEATARLILFSGGTTCTLELTAPTALGEKTLSPGKYTLTAESIRPGKTLHHVFAKSFTPNEDPLRDAFLQQWRARGYDPQIHTLGRRFTRPNATPVDNRIYWVSLARVNTTAEAERIKKKIEPDKLWAWIREDTIEFGHARIILRDAAGNHLAAADDTLELHARGTLRAGKASSTVDAPLRFRISAKGALEALAILPIEDYLRGVLPGEMPPAWPIEALKAQAIAARSEALAMLDGKHGFDDADFCTLEHCRVYTGPTGFTPTTDQAVQSTRGQLLLREGRIAETFFHANCGGWTEDNDTVWSGLPNPALRARGDMAKPPAASLHAYGVAKWLSAAPAAYCSADTANYRWTKRYSIAELSAILNKTHNVGTIRAIEPGPRGPGGRLLSLRVSGANGTATLQKDVAIRKAFGGLPSALFTITMDNATVVLRGAGRGHGVGMCQQGANGMARQGFACRDILRHYFTGVDVESLY